MLRARLSEEVYTSWFKTVEFASFDGRTVKISVPTAFLKNWIQRNYGDLVLECCAAAFKGAKRIDVVVRQHGPANGRAAAEPAAGPTARGSPGSDASATSPRKPSAIPGPALVRTCVNGIEGSSVDPRLTFASFVVGEANQMAHMAARRVAESDLSLGREENPLYLHSGVGLGKTHLLHAIAWEVKRRSPKAQVFYLTAERFRQDFVQAIRAHDGLAFKDKFRAVDILLIDDVQFMQGDKTEQEFEHIINAMLDSGRQVVVAAPRPPAQLDHLDDRMRSRLHGGLVIEISALDYELRFKILEKRVQEKRAADPSFEVPAGVVKLFAERLTENGRELVGAVNRLHLNWELMRNPITLETAETLIRDLVLGVQPARIKVDDIIRIVSRHFAVSKADIISQRRHRSVVRPRQIGMYLAKHLTSRSLPEIGRRFGDRDHTTVLHAIRKIDREVEENPRLKEEIEDLKRQLSR